MRGFDVWALWLILPPISDETQESGNESFVSRRGAWPLNRARLLAQLRRRSGVGERRSVHHNESAVNKGSYRRYEGLFIQRRGGGHRGVRTPSPGYHHPRPEGRITRPRNTTEEKKARSYNLAQHDSEIRHFIRKSSRRRPEPTGAELPAS